MEVVTCPNASKEENHFMFFENLEKLCCNAGKSMNQVERELGYPRNCLHNFKYKASSSMIRFMELADYFGVSPGELMDGQPHSIKMDHFYQNLKPEQKRELMTLMLQDVEKQLEGFPLKKGR